MRQFSRRAVVAGLLALALTAPALAGAVKGPVRYVGVVQGFSVNTYRLAFRPGQRAVVAVQGDGDTTLALAVFDSQGRRVAVDTRNSDQLAARWVARGSAPYVIKVVNRGGVPNRFLLRSN